MICRTTIVLALAVGELTISSAACDDSGHSISIASVASASSTSPVTPTPPLAPATPPPPGTHKLAVQTSPGASCWIHAQGSPVAAQNRPIYADATGLLRFYFDSVTEHQTDPHSFTQLDCTTQDGSVLASQLIDPIAAASFEQSASAAIKASATLRPRLQGDVNAFSQTALLQAGFPIRPDPSDQAQYQRWLQNVSTPFQQLPPGPVVHPGDKNTLQLGAYSDNWAGPVIANPGTKYFYTTGEYKVPGATPSANGNLYNPDQWSFWVGLDGGQNGTQDVCQAGTQATITYIGLGSYYTQYMAWIDWAGTGNEFENGLSIATDPGDTMFFNVWVGDANESPDFSGQYCWAIVFNFTTNQVTTANYGIPSGITFAGATAEWIVERPQNCNWFFGWSCYFPPLANFGTAQMTYPLAYDVNWGSHTPSSDSGSLDWMYANSNSTGILAVSLTTFNGVDLGGPYYFWEAPY